PRHSVWFHGVQCVSAADGRRRRQAHAASGRVPGAGLRVDAGHRPPSRRTVARSDTAMKVTIRFFARAKDLAGADALTLDVPDDGEGGALRRVLAWRFPDMASLLTRSAFAVDNEFAEDTQRLRADAEIALLPPVSGG